MRKLLTLITLLSAYECCLAQAFLNLDFEYGTYEDQPRKWVVEGEGDFSAKLDETTFQHGKTSLAISVNNAEAYTFLSLPGNIIAGKTVEVSGFIKGIDTTSLQVMLAFKDPDGKSSLAPVTAWHHGQWMSFSHKSTFHPGYSSDRLLVAVIAVGTGRFYFDNVTIKIDGHEYGNGPPDFREPSKKEINILNTNAIQITSPEIDSDLRDIEALGKAVGNSTIVGLGENSHGSSSIYKLKLRLVKYLVLEKGFTIFALESPVVEADMINDYVTTGTGTQQEVLEHLVYPSWRTQEMLDIIEFIKTHNASSRAKVQFRGIDMQDGMPGLKKILEFSEQFDTAISNRIRELIADYQMAANGKSQWNTILNKADSLGYYLKTKTLSDYPNLDHEQFMRIKKYAAIVVQSISAKANTNSTRDNFMAENVAGLKGTTDVRIIVSADNSHLMRATGKMGDALNKKFRNAYLPVGFTFESGTYSAYGDKPFYNVHPPHTGTYEYLLSKCRYNNFILDLRQPDVKQLTNTQMGFRSIGSRPQETTQFSEIVLPNDFDMVVFLKKSVHTLKK